MRAPQNQTQQHNEAFGRKPSSETNNTRKANERLHKTKKQAQRGQKQRGARESKERRIKQNET